MEYCVADIEKLETQRWKRYHAISNTFHRIEQMLNGENDEIMKGPKDIAEPIEEDSVKLTF